MEVILVSSYDIDRQPSKQPNVKRVIQAYEKQRLFKNSSLESHGIRLVIKEKGNEEGKK